MNHAASYRRLLEEILGTRRKALETWAGPVRDHAAAHAAARPSWQQMAYAWQQLEALLPQAPAHKDPSTIDAWLDFCEQDVPAFRAGYLKEQVYRALKKAPLDARQRARVRALALHHARAPQHRRELGRLGDLAGFLADAAYVADLARLREDARDGRDRYKVDLLLLRALHHHPELQPHAPPAPDLEREVDGLRRARWARRVRPPAP